MLSINGANIIIDPGADFDIIQKHLKGYNIKPDFILNTHGHHDHIGAVSDIILNYKIPFYISSKSPNDIFEKLLKNYNS